MKYLLLTLLFCIPAQAHWFEVQDLYLEGNKFTGRGNDDVHTTIGRKMDKSMSLTLDVDYFSTMFFSTKVEGRTGCINNAQCQFDEISYSLTTGIRVFPWLDLNYRHISTHALDNSYGYNVEDSVGFRIYLINSDHKDVLLP